MIRLCPHSASQCVYGMRCTQTYSTEAYDGNKNLSAAPMTAPDTNPPAKGGAEPVAELIRRLRTLAESHERDGERRTAEALRDAILALLSNREGGL